MRNSLVKITLFFFSLPDEADDDDDPEYNFLEDLDEPDTEDFRNDRAVRITSTFPLSTASPRLTTTIQPGVVVIGCCSRMLRHHMTSRQQNLIFNVRQCVHNKK